MLRRERPAATATRPSGPSRGAGRGRMPRPRAARSHTSIQIARIARPMHARSVLQPLVAGERTPLLGERGDQRRRRQRPSCVNRSHTMWLTTPRASDDHEQQHPRPRHRPSLRPPGSRTAVIAERVAQRARRAAIPAGRQPHGEPPRRELARRRTQRAPPDEQQRQREQRSSREASAKSCVRP